MARSIHSPPAVLNTPVVVLVCQESVRMVRLGGSRVEDPLWGTPGVGASWRIGGAVEAWSTTEPQFPNLSKLSVLRR